MGKILVFILWLLILPLYWWIGASCCSKSENSTPNIEESVEEEVPVEWEERGPLVFEFDDDSALTNEKTKDYLNGVIDGINEGEKLHIDGLYSDGEENSTVFENLGLARAYMTKVRMAEYMDTIGITLGFKKVNASETPPKGSFSAIIFDSHIQTVKIKKIDDRTLIYFPFNSTLKIEDDEIESYLNDVANRVKASGEVVKLIGHTDSSGNAKLNYKLGKARANTIARYLISKGVPKAQLNIDSKGEASPITANTTEEGRSANRRTELVITK